MNRPDPEGAPVLCCSATLSMRSRARSGPRLANGIPHLFLETSILLLMAKGCRRAHQGWGERSKPEKEVNPKTSPLGLPVIYLFLREFFFLLNVLLDSILPRCHWYDSEVHFIYISRVEDVMNTSILYCTRHLINTSDFTVNHCVYKHFVESICLAEDNTWVCPLICALHSNCVCMIITLCQCGYVI